MDITEAAGLDRGAQFFRADLHIHSCVGSHDVSDTTATPEAIVQTSIDQGLSIIAITDHNEITAIDRALKSSAGRDLLVVPGVELSTAHGHLLCYLPTLEDLQTFHGRLSLDGRGTQDSRCKTGIIDILDLVKAGGGFALLAHIDGGKGLETELPTSTPHKKDIISHPALLGIELTRSDCVVSYSDLDPNPDRKLLGRQRIEHQGLGKTQFLARVLNSDSHTLAALGRNAAGDRKVTRYKMQDVSFEGLRLALQDADARVRIEEEIPGRVPMVSAISLEGKFLAGQGINFSPNLNCIIGGRGTGKSTTFEAIRCLAGQGAGDVVDSEVWPDMIDMMVEDQAGQRVHLRRRLNGAVEDGSDAENVPLPFPVECYAQSEAASISQSANSDPASLLNFLDRFIDVGADLVRETELRQALLDSEADLKKAAENVARISGVEKDLAYKKSQLAALEAQKGKEVIALIRKLDGEKQLRISLRNDLAALIKVTSHDALKERAESMATSANPATLTVGSAEYTSIARDAATFKAKAWAAGRRIGSAPTLKLAAEPRRRRSPCLCRARSPRCVIPRARAPAHRSGRQVAAALSLAPTPCS